MQNFKAMAHVYISFPDDRKVCDPEMEQKSLKSVLVLTLYDSKFWKEDDRRQPGATVQLEGILSPATSWESFLSRLGLYHL